MNKITKFDNNPFANKALIKNKIRFYISQKNLDFKDVYKRACISRATFYNLVDGRTAPTQEKCRQLCLGLKLSLNESSEFLNLCGFNFVEMPVDKAFQKFLCLEKRKDTWKSFLNFLYDEDPESTDGRYKIFAA